MKQNFEKLAKIVYYPCGAGGKFIINSLGLSQHNLLHDIDLAEWDINQTLHNEQYYLKKLEIILKTVPDTPNNLQWQDYELGVGTDWETFQSERLKVILQSNTKTFCDVAHKTEQAENFQNNYPNITIIKLTNYTQWMRRSSFKVKELNQDLERKLAYWQYIDQQEVEQNKFSNVLVDIDNNIDNQQKMESVIRNLYQQLNFDDFQPKLWQQYYNKYMRAHL